MMEVIFLILTKSQFLQTKKVFFHKPKLIWTGETSPTIRKPSAHPYMFKLRREMENWKIVRMLTSLLFSISDSSLTIWMDVSSFLTIGLVSSVQISISLWYNFFWNLFFFKLESEIENSKDANILTIFEFSISSLSLTMYGCADGFLIVELVSLVQILL